MYSFEKIEFASPDYDESLALRYKVLRAPLGLEFSVDQIEEEWDQHFFVLRNQLNKIIACLVLKTKDNSILQMRQVAVDECLQGKGIGSMLVMLSEEWAKKQGYQKIVLNARDLAVPFYLKCQYSTFGEEFVEVGIPHREMYKEL